MSKKRMMKKITAAVVLGGGCSPVAADSTELPVVNVVGAALDRSRLVLERGNDTLVDTAELVERMPGANVNRNGPLANIAQYRGMYGERVDVSVDGYSWKEAGPGGMDPGLSQIPESWVDSVELFRGIAPVSSGIETIGGAMKVNIRKGGFARDNEDIAFHGKASGRYSMVDNGNALGLSSSLASRHHKLYLNGSTEEGNDYKFENDKAVRPSQYDREAYTLGYGYQRQGHNLDINYRDQSFGHTGTPALPMDILFFRGGVTHVAYQGDLGEGHSLEARFDYQNVRHAGDNYSLRDAPLNRMTGSPNYRRNFAEVDGFAASLAYVHPLFGGKLRSGVDVDQSHHDTDITDPGNGMFYIENFKGVKRDRYSLFSEWNGQLARDWSLELGARLTHVRSRAGKVDTSIATMSSMMGMQARALRDQFNNSDRKIGDNNIDLAVVLNYAWNDNLSLEAGVARKTRSPSYQELFLWLPAEATSGLADNRVYIGDTSLNHEVAYQFELGMEWQSERVFFAPRFFYHHVDDYIQGIPSSNATANRFASMMTGAGALQFANIDARLYGMDVDMGLQITEQLRLDGVISYVRGRRRDTGDNLYRIAPFNGRGELSWQQQSWSVSMETVFATAQNDVARFNRESDTPGYALLNLKSAIEPVNGLHLSVGVNNVMDKQYYDHLGGYNRARGNSDLAVDNVSGDRVRLPGQGRNYYAMLNYSW